MRVLVFLLSLSFIQIAYADQTVILNYNQARDRYFYLQLYPNGGETIYCGATFTNRTGLNVEHVYAASWMKETAGCPSNRSRSWCRDHSDRFNLMEADLHNLFPALAETNQARSNYIFSIIGSDDDTRSYSHPRAPGGCDFEVDSENDLVEPPTVSRGEVARAVFYMHHEYGVPIDTEMGQLLLDWNSIDTPSDNERWRNNKIEELQGTRNPFIDNYTLANNLSFAPPTTTSNCLIKGNISRAGKIYHVPGSRSYNQVKIDVNKGERWFCTIEDAINAGWRAPR